MVGEKILQHGGWVHVRPPSKIHFLKTGFQQQNHKVPG